MNDQAQIQLIEQIGGLLFRKFKGGLTEAESHELEKWLETQSPANRKFFETITEEKQVEQALQYLYSIDEDAALQDVQQSIQVTPVVPMVPVQQKTSALRYFTWKQIAAAVTIATVLTTGIVYTLIRKKNTLAVVPVEQRYHNDVAPGAEKAILQLADGSRIVLDSLQNGSISGTNALKRNDGTLEYQPAAGSKEAGVVSYNTLSVPRGGQYQVTLPDGSKVWLNAASSLTYPTAFTGAVRRVEITGEGYFEIAKVSSPKYRGGREGAMPFIVSIDGKAEVEVLGTHFNINAYDDEEGIKTTLLEGKVRMRSEVGKLVPASRDLKSDGTVQTSDLRPQTSVVLISGQQAQLNAQKLTTTNNVDIEETIAWKNGLFQFQDATIESIMRQVSRWYDVEIVYQEKVDKRFIGKIPRRVPLSSLLKILENTGWVHFVIEGKKITVAP